MQNAHQEGIFVDSTWTNWKKREQGFIYVDVIKHTGISEECQKSVKFPYTYMIYVRDRMLIALIWLLYASYMYKIDIYYVVIISINFKI